MSQYGEPGKDSPQAVLLPNVVGTGTKALLSANNGIEVLSPELNLTVHHVAEKLPASGSLEEVQVQPGSDKIHGSYKFRLLTLNVKVGDGISPDVGMERATLFKPPC